MPYKTKQILSDCELESHKWNAVLHGSVGVHHYDNHYWNNVSLEDYKRP